MKRRYAALLGICLGIVGSVVGFVTVARSANEPSGPPIGPRMAKDRGAGEVLVAVVGGVYATKADADAANASLVFGDVQGYYVVPVDQFGGLREQVGTPGDFVLASVFRTDEGAQQFAQLAATFGAPATILPQRVTSLGGVYAGLGQEANPQGTGPLTEPIPESLGIEDSDT